jgi:hypothetical protein
MNRFILGTALALSLSAPAFASEQLAASLGVNPDNFTTAELIQLRSAQEENDQATVDFILSGADSGSADVAAIQLAFALEDDDRATVNFLRNGGSEVVSTQSFGSAGGEQLAASLGVDAGDYTVAELIQLRSALDSDEHARARAILN